MPNNKPYVLLIYSFLQSTTLLLRISAHTQQICGLSFSKDGAIFATGGNDNLCCLFETSNVLEGTKSESNNEQEVVIGSDGIRRVRALTGEGLIKELGSGSEMRKWVHGAAVSITMRLSFLNFPLC